METIKVNMSPNPLDVQTIHASQNDTEARQWEFELHNNGDVIDASEISDQLVFKAYKGGTEQLLPENTSTPTTSPFKGDIRYPQGSLTDQEFTYRQSPTEEDGNAKIKSLYGKTLVWNQLVQNGNFADKSNWIEANATFTVNNNVATMVASASYGNIEQILSVKANHMYFATCDIKLTTGTNFNLIQFRPYVGVSIPCVNTTEWQTLSGLFIPTTDATVYYPRITDARASGWDAIQIRNCMVVDLTQMGLGVSSPSEFTSLFSLPYYDFNQGSLLSFNGNGIKTVGKNRLNYDEWKTVETRNGTSVWENNGVTITATANDAYTLYGESTFPVNARIPISVGERITLSWESDDNVNGDVYIFPNGTSAGFVKINNRLGKSLSYTPIDGVEYVTIRFGVASSGNTIHYKNIMIRFADTDDAFEPYTSSTLSLPISTYFPNGMDGVGTDYDELTNTKATTRMTRVDLGTLTYTYTQTSLRFEAQMPSNYKIPTSVSDRGNMICAKYSTNPNPLLGNGQEGITGYQNSNKVFISDQSTTDPVVFKTMMNGVYLVYPLATPTETTFTTASLVTENAEIPLSNEDGILIGKCTEQLSAEPGFHDAKIKLADDDGECYSNKIQLHIERSPQ